MMTDAATLTKTLRGKWLGQYGLAYCPAHQNTRTPALSLANSDRGRLLAYCHAGCEFSAIMKSLSSLGLIESKITCSPPNGAELTRQQADSKAQAKSQSARAHQLWCNALPIAGTAAASYLRARGITCQLPETLRYFPLCRHTTGQHLPAMMALVEGSNSVAVHRTFLCADGSGKAQMEPTKMMLGSCAGGAVRLSQTNGSLVICEGLETGLSLLSGLLQGPATVWAALSTSGMKSLKLPPRPGQMIIASDGDAAGRMSAHALASRADAMGWRVSLFPAPEGCDWNDVLKGGTA
ncbi:MAG: DUF7146 domain-containing protein [Parvibaculaceae bacterium]